MHPIIEQALYYGIVMAVSLLIAGLLLRGFFWTFIRVRVSFGRLLMVKIRAVNRDYFRAGYIDEGFLVFKARKHSKRVSIPNKDVFYRCMGVAWVDIDEEKNALVKPDFSVVDGFDSEKYENLYKRTLYKPAIADNKEKIMIAGILLIAVGIAVLGFFLYKQNMNIELMAGRLSQVLSKLNEFNKGVVVASTP